MESTMESPRKPERDFAKLKRLSDFATELRDYRDDCVREYCENYVSNPERLTYYQNNCIETSKAYYVAFDAWLALAVEYGEIVYCNNPM